MYVKKDVQQKAEGLFKEPPLKMPLDAKYAAAKDLRKCLASNVFGFPFPALSDSLGQVMIPDIKVTMCHFTDADGKPADNHPRFYRPRQLRKEIRRFHRCICETSSTDFHQRCHFNMLQTGYNITALNAVIGNHTETTRARLTYRSKEFYCHLLKNYTVICRIKEKHLPVNDTQFYRTLVCLSSALEFHVCDSDQHTVPNHPVRSTVVPTIAAQKAEIRRVWIIFLTLGCVLFLLIGITITVCGVSCWKNRQKRRNKKSMVKRSHQQVRSNSYADTMNHVYDYLPDQSVPDILREGHGSVVHSRFGSERSISVSSTLRSVSYSPSVRENGYYEPLTRPEDKPSIPERPRPHPRWQLSAPAGISCGPNDYLDLIEENQAEDDVTANHTYFVVEETRGGSKTQQPYKNKGEYVALCDHEKSTEDNIDDDDVSTSETNDCDCTEAMGQYPITGTINSCSTVSIKERDLASESSKQNVTSNCFGEDSTTTTRDAWKEVPETDSCPEEGQYEVPIPETDSFDLASSFRYSVTQEKRDERLYKDYQTIIPGGKKDSEEDSDNNPTYFVLES